jgi:methyl-accepting chemotaxis protein
MANGSEQVKASAVELSEVAGRLQNTVQQFKV